MKQTSRKRRTTGGTSTIQTTNAVVDISPSVLKKRTGTPVEIEVDVEFSNSQTTSSDASFKGDLEVFST